MQQVDIHKLYGLGSVNDAVARSGLTDPECHNNYNDFVTVKATNQQSSCSSTGSSCRSTDDDSDGFSTDKDEQDFDTDEESVSLSIDSRKWISEDGYNLTTFDQTEGIWSAKHSIPLPLPRWAKKAKKPFIIEKVKNL